MGEAKRRKILGIPPRIKRSQRNKTERVFSWLPIKKSLITKYPYAAPVTMAIGLILLLVDWTNIDVGVG